MSLKKKAIGGVKQTTASTVAVTILQLAQMSILARFLEPGDFRLMAIIIVVIRFSQALIQRSHQLTKNDATRIFYVNLSWGTLMYLLLFFVWDKSLICTTIQN